MPAPIQPAMEAVGAGQVPARFVSGLIALVAAGLLLLSPAAAAAPTVPAVPGARAAAGTTLDLAAATCNYVQPPYRLSLTLPPGDVTRNPNRGPAVGCFWGTPADLDRALSPKGANFEKLDRGIFQSHVTSSIAYRNGKFTDEDTMPAKLAASGVQKGRVERRRFAGHPGLVVTGRTAKGSDLYMLYLALEPDDKVLLIHYRPATPPTAADGAAWQRFLESIH